MSRRLAELDRLDAQDQAAGAETVLRRRGLSRAGLVYLLSVVVVAVGFVVLGDVFPGLLMPAAEDGIRTRPPSSAATGPYTFMKTTPAGRPVSYDPCRQIPYVVNPAGMPPEGMQLIQEAVDEISKASGLEFIAIGTTQERPHPERGIADASLAGDGWPPVLIAWVTAAEYPIVGDNAEGIGGSTTFEPDGPESARYVTGQIVLERDRLSELLTEKDGYIHVRAIIVHELAHVVGLDHVDDPGELMAPTYNGLTGLGPGDRQGLAQLGAGPCWPES